MHDTLFIVLKTKHNLSIFEPEIKNPLSIFEPVGQNEYAYKKKTCTDMSTHPIHTSKRNYVVTERD